MAESLARTGGQFAPKLGGQFTPKYTIVQTQPKIIVPFLRVVFIPIRRHRRSAQALHL
jgi:hypothetical protein